MPGSPIAGPRSPFPPVYPILDAEWAGRRGHDPVALAARLPALGCPLVQLRAKTLPAGAVLDLARRLVDALAPSAGQLIVNDRADIAVLAGAAGVHLGQEDLSSTALAAIWGRELRVIGLSTHNPGQVRAAAASPHSYLAIGPVFATGSKANPDPVVGLDGVRAARALVPAGEPLVAIGGITVASAAKAWSAGATSVAVISAWLDAADPLAALEAILAARP